MALASSYSGGSLSGALECEITQVDDSIVVYGNDGTTNRAIKTDSTGAVEVNGIAGTISLPTGAATEATLSALNSKLASNGSLIVSVDIDTINPGGEPQGPYIGALLMGWDTGSNVFQTMVYADVGSYPYSIPVVVANDSGEPAYMVVSQDSTLIAEDTGHSTGQLGRFILGVRNDSNTTRTTADTDYSPFSVDLAGNIKTVGNITHDSADAGCPVKIGGYASSTAPTAVSANADRVNAWFDLNGRLQIGDGGGSLTVDGSVTTNENNKASATVSNVTIDASNFTVLSSNSSAVNRMVYNDSSTTVYLKFGSTATTSSYTIKMAAGSFYEIPQPIYTGQIDAIGDSATGSLRVTEY